MAVVLLVTPRTDEAGEWGRLLRQRIPGIDFRVHPDCGNPADIEVALAWKPPHGLLARDTVASVIAGATKPEQVRANVGAAGWTLTAEELAEVDRVAR